MLQGEICSADVCETHTKLMELCVRLFPYLQTAESCTYDVALVGSSEGVEMTIRLLALAVPALLLAALLPCQGQSDIGQTAAE